MELHLALEEYGYTFPMGTCPTVGLAGYTLGGGYGFQARNKGLGADQILDVEIVAYNSETSSYEIIYGADVNNLIYL